MSLNMFWFLPTHGDGHYLGTEEGSRPVDHGYLQQIAQAADRLGYTGVLIPTGRSCEDAWLVAASADSSTVAVSTIAGAAVGVITCCGSGFLPKGLAISRRTARISTTATAMIA